jgi:hypothetical protein
VNDLEVSEHNQRIERTMAELERAFGGPLKGSA